MYSTSQKWKENIYKNVQCAMNIYIDDVLINPDYILDFKKGGNVFDEELTLGSTPSQYIEMKIYKDKVSAPKKIKVEYGILINNALTVAEVNAMLVGTLNGIPVKSLSSNDSSFEMIPIGIYKVDDYTDNDDGTITIKALDNMIKFEFNYDGKELVDKKGYATLAEVAQDICNKAGVELGSTSFLNSDKQVAVYDNTVTAREYISYIAESAGCFAFIDRDGKLYFRTIGEDKTEIPLDMFGEYKWGEEFKISKVSYEDGTRSFKFGDDTRNNLWINQDNMYIVDEQQVQNIYNKVKDLTINSFEGKTVIDPAIDIGDKNIIDGKSIIYQGEMTLEGRFIADIKSTIQIKQKEETTVKKESQKVINRRVQSSIDQVEGKITQLVEETDKNSEKLSQHEQTIDSMKDTLKSQETKIETVENKADTAQSTANTATTKANNAQKTADSNTTKITTTTTKLAEVEKTVDGITQSVSKVEEKVESVEGDLEENYYNKTEMNTKIQQTNNKIDLMAEELSTVTGENNIVNGKFDNNLTNWTTAAEGGEVTVEEYENNKYANLKTMMGATELSQEIKALFTGIDYNLSFYIFDNGDIKISNYATFTVTVLQTTEYSEETSKLLEKTISVGDTKQKVSLKFKLNETSRSVIIMFKLNATNYLSSPASAMLTDIVLAGGNLNEKFAQINLTTDKINSEVKKTNNGLTTAKSEIKQTTDAISSEVNKKVDNDEFGTLISQNAYNVKIAWNNNSKCVQFEGDGITLYNGSVSTNNKRAVFDFNGNSFYRDGYYVGSICTGQWESDTSHKGLTFNLNEQGKYMAWAERSSSTGSFYTKICYSRANSIYTEEGLHIGANLYGHWNALNNFKIGEISAGGYSGYTGAIQVLYDVEYTDTGLVKTMYTTNLQVRNGIIVGFWN